jgi:hypothetical protein
MQLVTYQSLAGKEPRSVLIFYVEAANYIHVEPLHAKSAAAYLKALVNATSFLNAHRIPVAGFVLDNQISSTQCASILLIVVPFKW